MDDIPTITYSTNTYDRNRILSYWDWLSHLSKASSSSTNQTNRTYYDSHDGYDLNDFKDWVSDIQNTTKELTDMSKLHPASDVDINSVKAALAFNMVICFSMLIMYEVLRRFFPNVYATRKQRLSALVSRQNLNDEYDESSEMLLHHDSVIVQTPTFTTSNNNTFDSATKTISPTNHVYTKNTNSHDSSNYIPNNLPDVTSAKSPLEWIGPVFGIPWSNVREVAGLDAYFYLRYIRMCFRITSVSALWGAIVLFPVYSTGQNGAPGWYHLSMANVVQGSSWRIWVATLWLYFFSAYTFYVMKAEYRHYLELRLQFLGKGSSRVHPQHHYSAMVEQIPRELRSSEALYDYFDKLFPGKVHSANVVLLIPELDDLSKRIQRVTRRLEKSIAYFEATGKRPSHIVGRPRLMCCGIEGTPINTNFFASTKNIIDHENHSHVLKGERVDSITYYTNDLKQENKKLFLLQQKYRKLDSKSKDTSTNGWFNVSQFVNFFEDDGDDMDSMEGFTLSTSRRKKDSLSKLIIENTSIDEPTELLDTNSEDITEQQQQQQQQKHVQFPRNESPSKFYGSLDERKSTPTSSNSGRGGSFTKWNQLVQKYKSKRKSQDQKNTSGSKSSASSDDSNASKSKPLISDDFLECESKTETDFWSHDALIDDGFMYQVYEDHNTTAPNQTRRKTNNDIDTIDSSCAKSFVKLAGRIGLDFFMYSIKTLRRQFNKEAVFVDGTNISSTGFVTFLNLSSVTCAVSAPLTHKPSTLKVKVAPERRDILWEKVHSATDANNSRERNANIFLALGALLWSIPLAFIQAIASAENVAQIPGLDWILTYGNGNMKIFINSYLPVVALLALITILPLIFEWIAVSYERRKTRSEVERSIVGRYFYYQLANIYISVTAGSLWKSASDIIARPSAVFEILGNTLPTVVGYFISLLITKILGGLPTIILRFGALGRYVLLRLFLRKRFLTQRELDQVYRSQPLYYGWEYPSQLLVIVICFTYAAISPVILCFGALYFIGALMVYKKQVLYVYEPVYESGGSLFPLVCDRTIFALIFSQLTFIGYIIIRGGVYQPVVLMPLVYCTIWVMNYFRINFAEPSTRLTLERAMDLDIQSSQQTSDTTTTQTQGHVLQDLFTKEYYRQPVLTERPSEPLPYRRGHDDALTKEACKNLKDTRLHMWSKSMGDDCNVDNCGSINCFQVCKEQDDAIGIDERSNNVKKSVFLV